VCVCVCVRVLVHENVRIVAWHVFATPRTVTQHARIIVPACVFVGWHVPLYCTEAQ
jgi:hypothetical protein